MENQQTYSQDWRAYDQAKTNESVLFQEILTELVDYVVTDLNYSKQGRTGYTKKERILCLCSKIFHNSSLRKTESILKILKQLQYIHKVPAYKSIDNFFRDKELVPLLNDLILVSALPLAQVEETGAIDATGFGTSVYDRWSEYKWGSRPRSKQRRWVKLHACVGCKTNIFISARVTEKNVNDHRMFREVVGKNPYYFNMENFVADKAYSSRVNLEFLWKMGIMPYIPFKKDTSGKSRGSFIWRKMWLEFTHYKEYFMEKYHKRSNIECNFSMIKKRFGNTCSTKTLDAQEVELLAKVLCHNICVLIQELYERGINIDFDECVKFRKSCN